ncbi:MAG: aminoacetone oxidase family FAD-binding enzyme [Planctomycetes bacterium]|nr:aminoacetone oxidase family FAD-binding enzyme [Planctomycetota bacterium]
MRVSESCILSSVPARPEGEPWPVVIVGCGAAGMLAGIFAGRGGVRPLLLETRPKPGAKIRVSGGGRCNVLPSQSELDDFHTEGSRNSLKNLLASWPLAQCRAFFERELGVALKVEDTGKLFPLSDDAGEVLDALLRELERVGGQVIGGVRAEELVPLADAVDGARFEIALSNGARLRARSAVLATGGLSLPKTGSDGWGYTTAHKLGHVVLRRYPALVPLLCSEARWNELAGVSVVARLAALRGDKLVGESTGDLLFTHKGFSGPVALDMSRFLTGPEREGVELVAGWHGLSVVDWDERLRKGGTRTVLLCLREWLPRRLVSVLIDLARVHPERKLAELSREERKRLSTLLGACPLPISGDEGYKTAEVTGGGVALEEVATKTLESRRVPGLYLCGEVLDVTGRIGGFNFLWAWVSGRRVGQSLASPLPQV